MPELTESQKQMRDVFEARVAEFKTFEGKLFLKNDGTGHPVRVEKYAGVGMKDGVSIHVFQVEGHEARWTPPATQFLADYHEVEEGTKFQRPIVETI